MRTRLAAVAVLIAGCASTHCPPPLESDAMPRQDAPICATGRASILLLDGSTTEPHVALCAADAEPMSVGFFDDGGRRVETHDARCVEGTALLDLGELPTGTYLVSLSGGGGIYAGGAVLGDADCAMEMTARCAPLVIEVRGCDSSIVPWQPICSELTDDCGGGA